ncbi:hypothetical protein [Streptomyces albireticuli]|uniref:hypothetical protein n=1 Tax=Streptomyces albireticuli TaxID=1940 RepID=UPI001180A9C6|nr:hypothetical protein [Streptomyces albireticuli]MCD9193360.1 hypothetical protein [Streptomyces albireticuli]
MLINLPMAPKWLAGKGDWGAPVAGGRVFAVWSSPVVGGADENRQGFADFENRLALEGGDVRFRVIRSDELLNPEPDLLGDVQPVAPVVKII